ncbi:MAG TPA: cbb3-type cytochrome c oxidase subunit I [Armatimonadota bacterium]|nr:cbb3-type cytochrome c oxidase subunit I [Armatimonadota bacterium]
MSLAPPQQANRRDVLRHALMLSLILGFSALLFGGFLVFKSQAPLPDQVVAPDGAVLATRTSIKGGQAVYMKYGLMNYGSVLGHGAYLGPDFTAQSLHLQAVHMRDFYAREHYDAPYAELKRAEQLAVAEQVRAELKENRYDAATGTLALTAGQAYAFAQVRDFYREFFNKGIPSWALPARMISEQHLPATGRVFVAEGDQLSQIADFFQWTAWLSAVKRPGMDYSFTNNWPYDPDAGNVATYAAVGWSAVSVAVLLLMLAVVLYWYYRYNYQMEDAYTEGNFPTMNAAATPLTPSQRGVAKYFAVAILLFLAQSVLGGLLAHFYAEGNYFYGFDISKFLPFNAVRSWHLQLGIFWIATAWLAAGMYVAPIVSGREPKGQHWLVTILFAAVVLVAVGSLIGEWAGIKGYLGNLWYAFGQQGWEYLELGRVWQVLLFAGLGIWLFIVFRGMRDGLRREHDKGGLTHLLLYSAVAIPFFYIFGFLFNPSTHLTMSDYWRWWVIHLWVEGMFEVFAVVVVAFLLVHMGLVTKKSATRAVYFMLTLLLASGIIGTGHHYYWIGAPEAWIALGAVFSALEVIPLSLLIMEAWEHYRVVRKGGIDFPYRATFWFLMATAFWNLFGAGVLGFLINLPVVSYYQHGSFLTATHGHGALMGVYGMLALALILFALRNIVRPDAWKEKWIKLGFWGTNIGLMGMILITLLPVGLVQMQHSYQHGFWAARSLEFYRQPLVTGILWFRMLPDTVFIVLGVLPLAAAVIWAYGHLRKATVADGGEMTADAPAEPIEAATTR